MCVLFIGTQFSNLYTAVDTPARGRVVVCLVFVCLVFVCKYVLGHSRVSQPPNLRLCLLRHLGFLTSPYASPTCRGLRLNSCRCFRRFTPDPPPIPWAHLLHLSASLKIAQPLEYLIRGTSMVLTFTPLSRPLRGIRTQKRIS